MTLVNTTEQKHESLIGWQNLGLDADSIVASTPNADHPASNLINYHQFDYFLSAMGLVTVDFTLPASADCDYFAMYGVDFSTNPTIAFQYFDGLAYQDLVTLTPDSSDVVFEKFATVNATQFRLSINSPTDPTAIAMISFGKALVVPNGLAQGFESPHNAQQYRDQSNVSSQGIFLGRSVRKQSIPFEIATELVTYDWFIANWRPMLRHVERRPFFFKWSNNFYPSESVFAWTDGNIGTPRFTDTHFKSFSLQCRGVFE